MLVSRDSMSWLGTNMAAVRPCCFRISPTFAASIISSLAEADQRAIRSFSHRDCWGKRVIETKPFSLETIAYSNIITFPKTDNAFGANNSAVGNLGPKRGPFSPRLGSCSARLGEARLPKLLKRPLEMCIRMFKCKAGSFSFSLQRFHGNWKSLKRCKLFNSLFVCMMLRFLENYRTSCFKLKWNKVFIVFQEVKTQLVHKKLHNLLTRFFLKDVYWNEESFDFHLFHGENSFQNQFCGGLSKVHLHS